ncbi:cytochrome c oxidase assembly protein [Thermaurantiacus sp.]
MRAAPTTRTALLAGGLALAMIGAAYASVPLYRLFCAVTGFGGTPQVASEAAAVVPVAGQTIRVRFDGNVRAGLPWRFRPATPHVDVPIGERRIAYYRAANAGDQPVTGVATFNVSPAAAGRYFVKIQCFCFNEQTLRAGEAVDMPVIYYVDPAILEDPDARRIEEITLSYSFFPVRDPTAPPGIRATRAGEIARNS